KKTCMPRDLVSREEDKVPEKENRDAGDKTNKHTCSDITLRKHILKNVPGILADKVKNTFLIELKKCNAEGGRPNPKIVPDLRYMRYVQEEINCQCSRLPHGPSTHDFPRALGVRDCR